MPRPDEVANLRPDEVAALRQADESAPRTWRRIVLVALLLALLPVVIYLPPDGRADHLFGRTQAVSAEVTAVQDSGYCNRSSIRGHRVEVTWLADGAAVAGGSERGDYRVCGSAPAVGERVTVWAGPTGRVEAESPTTARLGLSLLTVIVVGLVVTLGGAVLVVLPRRARSRLLAASATPTGMQPVPVEVWLGHRRAWRMRPVDRPAGSVIGESRIAILLYSGPGVPPVTHPTPQVSGTWALRPVPAPDARRWVGVLERGQERCWVEFTVRRDQGW